MAKERKFKLNASEIKDVAQGWGWCIATDKITVEGELVDYMYQEESAFENDSGWRFFSGTESQEYVDDSNNSAVYNVNTIANYDPAVIPYLGYPANTHLERIRGTPKFQIIPG